MLYKANFNYKIHSTQLTNVMNMTLYIIPYMTPYITPFKNPYMTPFKNPYMNPYMTL
jgi:hypothetical protein